MDMFHFHMVIPCIMDQNRPCPSRGQPQRKDLIVVPEGSLTVKYGGVAAPSRCCCDLAGSDDVLSKQRQCIGL